MPNYKKVMISNSMVIGKVKANYIIKSIKRTQGEVMGVEELLAIITECRGIFISLCSR
jgi:hypothetical protein